MDTGTKMDQVAAVSRLLSDAAESDEVVIQCHGTYTDGMYTTKRFTVSLCHALRDAAEAIRVEAMLPPEMVPDVLRPSSAKMDAVKVALKVSR